MDFYFIDKLGWCLRDSKVSKISIKGDKWKIASDLVLELLSVDDSENENQFNLTFKKPCGGCFYVRNVFKSADDVEYFIRGRK